MKKLNICFSSPSKEAYSETFVRNLRNSIDGNIHFCYGGFIPFHSEDSELQNHYNAPLIFKGLEKLGYLKWSLAERNLIKYLKRKNIDLILANYGQSGAEMTKVAKELGIPMIVHFHGYDASVNEVIQKYKVKYVSMFEYASAIIVVSEEMKINIIGLGCIPDKIHLIRYSPVERFFEISPDYNSNQVLAIGRFVEKKAPYLSLLAMKEVEKIRPDIKIKFIGDGPLLNICKDIAEGLNLKCVDFAGVLSPNEIAFEMGISFCFIQHSKTASNGNREGTPVAILEAMASGIPIVSTFHAGIPDIIQNGINGYLVKEGDIEGMAKAIIKLYDDRDLAKRMGEENKKFIFKYHSQVLYKETWNKLINKIIIKN
ncbi:glycosyltransferase [Cyclobacterium roseum]|uniref:glycosyltransferase n=1 Tax=Cyclobacterium roseum TaxID=2666137 RepID=UPI0013916B74|nr:glycosyltransferase [Cyclobacterium roseum]